MKQTINNRSKKSRKSWHLEFRASKIMKAGFYYTDLQQNRSIKQLKVIFEYIFTIHGPKMAILILVFFPMNFLGRSTIANFSNFSYHLPVEGDLLTFG